MSVGTGGSWPELADAGAGAISACMATSSNASKTLAQWDRKCFMLDTVLSFNGTTYSMVGFGEAGRLLRLPEILDR
jgi:hypothetical protein